MYFLIKAVVISAKKMHLIEVGPVHFLVNKVNISKHIPVAKKDFQVRAGAAVIGYFPNHLAVFDKDSPLEKNIQSLHHASLKISLNVHSGEAGHLLKCTWLYRSIGRQREGQGRLRKPSWGALPQGQ